jgi:hypothetical protein
MTGKKYEKYLTRDCVVPTMDGSRLMMSTRQMEAFGEGHFSMDSIYMVAPGVINDRNHKHDFAQYLCFFSANPQDARDFDAEIELALGEEQEKQIITSPTVAYIAAGLYHGPLVVTKLNKPFLFIDVAMTARYTRVLGVTKE